MFDRLIITETIKRNYGYLALLAIMVAGSLTILWSQITLSANIAHAEELARPADIKLTIITASDCSECFDVSSITRAIENGPFNITDTEQVSYKSEAGRELVKRHEIKRVPTVVLTGEIEKSNADEYITANMIKKDGAVIWSDIPPVYIDTASDKVMGRVSVTLVTDSTCKECFDPSDVSKILENNYRLNISDTTTADIRSAKGAGLLTKYQLESVPAVILSADAFAYQGLIAVWPQVGTFEDDGNIVFRQPASIGATYKDVKTGKIIEPSNSQ